MRKKMVPKLCHDLTHRVGISNECAPLEARLKPLNGAKRQKRRKVEIVDGARLILQATTKLCQSALGVPFIHDVTDDGGGNGGLETRGGRMREAKIVRWRRTRPEEEARHLFLMHHGWLSGAR